MLPGFQVTYFSDAVVRAAEICEGREEPCLLHEYNALLPILHMDTSQQVQQAN
jgi:hypothetical protein